MRLFWKPMNPMTRKVVYNLLPLLMAIALISVGCAGTQKIKPKAWAVKITKKTPASIEVDLIGVTELEKPKWEGYSLDEYWKPDDPMRKNADKITMSLVRDIQWILDPSCLTWVHRY